MTKAEAAQELQRCVDLIKQDGKDWLDERDIPILEMAIDALRVEEIIHCKDCASASYDSLFNQYWCNGHIVSTDFHCAKGEIKTNGTTTT